MLATCSARNLLALSSSPLLQRWTDPVCCTAYALLCSALLWSRRAASEALARERTLSVLPVFVMALQCVPFIMPDHWAEGKVFEDLLLYTVHIEQPMRQAGAASFCGTAFFIVV